MTNFKNRIKALERRNSADEPAMRAHLMGIYGRDNKMPAHSEIERELGRPVSSALVREAERLYAKLVAFQRQAELSTIGSLRNKLEAEARAAAEGGSSANERKWS